MHTSGSILYTILEKVRAYLDLPDMDAKYDDSWIVRHVIAAATTLVMSRINMTTDAPIVLRFNVSLLQGVEHYILPPTVQEVWRIAKFDDSGRMVWDWSPEDEMHPWGPGWALDGNVLRIWPLPLTDEEVTVWYVPNASVTPHFSSGGSVQNFAFTTASWTEATKTVTKTGAFAEYEWTSGDYLVINAITGGATGTYVINSNTDNTLVLNTSPGAASANIGGYISNITSNKYITLSNQPLLGMTDRRENAYAGQVLRYLQPNKVWQERVIEAYNATTRLATLRNPITVFAAETAVYYEIMPPMHYALLETIAAWAAIKMGTIRKISQSHMANIVMQYQAEMKTIRDNQSNLQMRKPKHFKKDTIDNPNLNEPLALVAWQSWQ